jgi:hypothetical protein
VLQIRLHHHPDQVLEGDGGLPAELSSGLDGVALRQLDLGRAQQRRIDDDVLARRTKPMTSYPFLRSNSAR